jgi:hypothetical protein
MWSLGRLEPLGWTCATQSNSHGSFAASCCHLGPPNICMCQPECLKFRCLVASTVRALRRQCWC